MVTAIEQEIMCHATENCVPSAIILFEHCSEAVIVTNAENIIINVNPAFSKLTGYSLNEIAGVNADIVNSGLEGDVFFSEMRAALEETGHWEGEMSSRRKNGEIYTQWRRIYAVYSPDRAISRWITMFSDITPQKKSEELIWQQINFDSLTSLPNRHLFYNRLEQEVKKAKRAGTSMALILLDLDRFKEVNETYGHKAGDILLKEAAWRLNSCLRGIDTVARLGGDEFAVILGSLKNLISINRVVRDILRKMAEPFTIGNDIVYISASVGVTFYPQDASEAQSLVRNADQAMYSAKNLGRNCFSYFTHTLQQAAQIRMRLATDLRNALTGNQFELHYQPIIELSTGQIHKAEALLRWHHPQLGLVNPTHFISIAEETRMIVEIGDWVYRVAAQQAKAWRASHSPAFQISINTSPVQFRKEPDLHESWLGFLREIELSGQAVVIEITEGLLMDTNSNVTSVLDSLQKAGIQVALDDFGTGYSSLSYLKKFDINYLKIDQTFVQTLAAESDDLALCEAIIMMAHKLGIKVIAEGIETAEQCRLLADAGCNYGQGNLFSKAVPADKFQKLMEERQTWPIDTSALQLTFSSKFTE